MLEPIEGLPGHVAGLIARGRVRKADYQDVVFPMIETARRDGRRLRLLYELGDEFEGFTPAAMLADARLGLNAADALERVAVVTDSRWLRMSSDLLSNLSPSPVRMFHRDERSAALEWLERPAEHRGLSHRVLADGRVVLVVVVGAIAGEDFDALELTVDQLLSQERLRGLVIQLKVPPSWESLGSLWRHLRFVRQHHRRVHRVALVTDAKLGALAPLLANGVVSAELHCFGAGDLEVAAQWAGRPEPEVAEAREHGGEPLAAHH